MKKPIMLFLIINFFAILLTVLYSFAAEERITLTTYYPAPYGIYKEMRVDQMAVGSGYRYSPALTDGMFLVLDKVGINTTNPYSRLEVDGGFELVNPSSATGTGQVIVRGTGNLRSPNNGSAIAFMLPANTDGTGPWEQARILATPDNSVSGSAAGRMYLQTRYLAPGPEWLWRNNIVLMSTGRVGIGTTNPLSPLTVYENTGNVGENNGLIIQQAGDGDAKLQFFLNGTDNFKWSMGVDNSDSNKFKIATVSDLGYQNQYPILVIDTFGRVGIGTTNPTEKLEIDNWGGIKLEGPIIFDEDEGSIWDASGVISWGNSTPSVSSKGGLFFRQNHKVGNTTDYSPIMTLYSNNSFVFGGGPSGGQMFAVRPPVIRHLGVGGNPPYTTYMDLGRDILFQSENGPTGEGGGDIILMLGGPGSGSTDYGKVGIGTADPQATLHVAGNMTVSGDINVTSNVWNSPSGYSYPAGSASGTNRGSVSCPPGEYVIGIEVWDNDGGGYCTNCLTGVKVRCSKL